MNYWIGRDGTGLDGVIFHRQGWMCDKLYINNMNFHRHNGIVYTDKNVCATDKIYLHHQINKKVAPSGEATFFFLYVSISYGIITMRWSMYSAPLRTRKLYTPAGRIPAAFCTDSTTSFLPAGSSIVRVITLSPTEL